MENKPAIIEMMNASLEKIRAMVDVDTVVGKPITTPDGTTVIPVSNVSFGFGAGGTDWGKESKQNFGGGAGAGVSVTPLSFLVISENGVRVVPVEPSESESTADKIIDAVPKVIDTVENLLKRYGK